ncbi:MAG: chaperonin GroEL [Bacilli bacterium]|nr:chaperonin GroEL [Bacilli bacterium]
MSRTAHFGKDTQKALVEGLNYVGNAVKSTLGPAGKTVIIQRKDKSPILTKDGISVAKELSPKDEKIKLGADLAISIAQKQMNSVGDNTTTACILGQALVNNGIRQIELANDTATVNRTSLRKGIEKARDYVIKELDKLATPVDTDERLIQVATVSANWDEDLGKTVADAYSKVGKNGVVTVEETKDRNISLVFKEGMTLNRGWTSQYFVTDYENQTVEYDNPLILLCNSRISNFTTLANLIEPLLRQGSAIILIAEGFDTNVTQGLVMNRLRINAKLACIEAPGYGDKRLEILRDLGVYLNAEVAEDPMGMKLEMFSSAQFGQCEKIIIKKDETIIRGGKGDPAKIKARVEAIEGMIKATADKDQWEKDQLNKRLAALTTGVAIIRVGGSSEEEIKELKDRVDDAQWACKSALEEGFVPGAGNTMLVISNRLEEHFKDLTNSDEMLGIKIFANALKAPFRVILDNAGINSENIQKEILAKDDVNYGYDALNLKMTNLIESGIIDTAKGIKGAIYAATSVAGLVLTSDVCITEDPVDEKGLSLNMMGMPAM